MAGPPGPTADRLKPAKPNSGLDKPEFRYLAIGRIVRAHGVRGEVSVTILTDFPERFAQSEWLYIGNEYEADIYQLKSHRWHKQTVLLSFAGITDRNKAEQLIGQQTLQQHREIRPFLAHGYHQTQFLFGDEPRHHGLLKL